MHAHRCSITAPGRAWIVVLALLTGAASVRPASADGASRASSAIGATARLQSVFAPQPPSSLIPSLRLDATAQPQAPLEGPGTPASSKSRYAVPMLLSAIVPGAGEISMGRWWNGLPLVAADVATWLGYAHYRSEGNSRIDDYEAFADEHWSEVRWQENLPLAEDGRHYDENDPPWHCDCSPPYIPRDEDLREYYENLGKYSQFFPGWDDWHTEYDPEDPTSRRRIYADMRIEANSSFDNADRLLGVAALTRVVSIVQSFWLVRRESRSQDSGLMIEPVTFRGLGSGLRVRASF
jgi:hypothetical protein